MRAKPMTVWVGYSDGKPHIYRDYVGEVRYVAVFPSRRAASREYEDVRKATLVLVPVAKTSTRRRQA